MRKIRVTAKQNEETVRQYKKDFCISDTAARVLFNRVGEDTDAAKAFMSNKLFEFFDPFLIDGMDNAVARLHSAIENRENVVIYGDYDVDGITSVALMLKYLTSKGLSPSYYIPDRSGEGYGMNAAALKKLRDEGAELIITVDNGITAVSEISEGIKYGLDFIVTDHHECQNELPDTPAIINPKLSKNCPFRELAGVGVAFKLLCAAEGAGSEKRLLKEYGEIVAIGTVADVVPLLSENREIARVGLKKMNDAFRPGGIPLCPGVAALIELLNKNGREITSQTVGYMLSPRINAAGRMGSTENAVALFMAADRAEGLRLANCLIDENRSRQETETELMKEAEAALKTQVDLENDRIMVISGSGWHHGVIGIIASRLSDRYFLPSVLISEENGSAKGSGRSISGFNLFEALAANSGYLRKFGGHELAAGLSLDSDKIPEFRDAMRRYAAEKISDEMLVERLEAECALNLGATTKSLCDELMRFEPCGTANPQPLFLFSNLKVVSASPLSSRRFTRYLFSDVSGECAAVDFGCCYDSSVCGAGDTVNVIASVNENIFRDRVTMQLIIKDIELVSENPPEPDVASAAAKDVPSAETLRGVFRYFRDLIKNECSFLGLNPLADHICDATKLNISRNTALFAVMIFNELGIIRTHRADGGLYLDYVNTEGKVSLNDSPTYRRLSGKEE